MLSGPPPRPGRLSRFQLPSVLRSWLQPAQDGRAFLPSSQRASLLKVLMVLPVQKSHLRESGIGKLVVAMAADPEETRDNRELIKQAREGNHPVFLVSSFVGSAQNRGRGSSEGRLKPQPPKH